MLKLSTRPLTRDQIVTAIGNNPRAIRVIEQLTSDVGATLPDVLDQIQADVQNLSGAVNALALQISKDRQNGEAARMLQLNAQLEQLREQVSKQENDSTLLLLNSQVAELRELLVAGGSMKVRTINDVVMIPSGFAEATYTISPPLSSVSKAFLAFTGAYNVYGPSGGSMLITSTTTISFKTNVGVSADTYGRFSLVEFQ